MVNSEDGLQYFLLEQDATPSDLIQQKVRNVVVAEQLRKKPVPSYKTEKQNIHIWHYVLTQAWLRERDQKPICVGANAIRRNK